MICCLWQHNAQKVRKISHQQSDEMVDFLLKRFYYDSNCARPSHRMTFMRHSASCGFGRKLTHDECSQLHCARLCYWRALASNSLLFHRGICVYVNWISCSLWQIYDELFTHARRLTPLVHTADVKAGWLRTLHEIYMTQTHTHTCCHINKWFKYCFRYNVSSTGFLF